MLDGHQPLAMFLVVVLYFYDPHEALLILHLTIINKSNIKSECLLTQDASAGFKDPWIVDVGTPSLFLLLHKGPDVEEEVLVFGLLFGLIDLVLLALELVDVVVIFVDLVQFSRGLDVFPEIQKVGVNTSLFLLFRIVEVFLGPIGYGVLLGLVAAVEVYAIF